MDLVVRAAVAFLFVYLLTRIIGRRELSSMQPFDLILLVMIGDLVQQGVTQNDFSVTGALLVGGTIALMTVARLVRELQLPAPAARARRRAGDRRRGRQADRAQPAPEPDHARGARGGRARRSSSRSLDDVRWAVLETNGRISFIPKSDVVGSRLPLYLTEARRRGLLTPGDAVPVIEACFRRLAAGGGREPCRGGGCRSTEGGFAVMSAVDRELGYAGVKSYAALAGKAVFAVLLFDLAHGRARRGDRGRHAGQRRTGAASGVAAKHLARPRRERRSA